MGGDELKSNDNTKRSEFDKVSLLFAEIFDDCSFTDVALTLLLASLMLIVCILLIVGMIFMIIKIPATIIIPIVIFLGIWFILETNKRAKEINGRGYLS